MKHTVRKVKLKNGAEGLLINVPDASVMSFELNFRAGEYLLEREKWEAAHIMEHVLLGANQQIRTSRAFQAELEKNGAYANAYTNVYHISYEAECADFEWERVLELFLLAIAKPLFLENEFLAEKGNVREELVGRSNNHFRHLSLALRQQYGLKAITDQERLVLMDNVTLDDVRKHYKNTHFTSNLRFIVCGNVSSRSEQIVKLLEGIELPVGDGRIELPEEVPTGLDKALFLPNKTVDNVHFYIDTFHNGNLIDEEWDALNLVNTMLTETLHSKILGTARERGLVYGMGSGFGQTRDSVSWWIGTQVTKANAPALMKLIKREYKKVLEGDIEKEDIQAAKQYGLGRFQRSAQTVAGISSGYAGRYFFEDVVDDYYKYPERINGITKAQIIATARKMFGDKVWGIGTLGRGSQALSDRLMKQIADLWE